MIAFKMLIRSYSHTLLTDIHISVTKIFFLMHIDNILYYAFLQIDLDRFVTQYGHNKVLSIPIFKIIFSAYDHAYYI